MTVAVLGEALIDFIGGDDGAYRPHLGGSPFNVAIGVARQGVPVSYLSPLSDDAFGDRLAGTLDAEGVGLPCLRRSVMPTSLALVTIGADRQPSYRLYREGIADKNIDADEVLALLPDDLALFHTGSLAITPSQLPKIRTIVSTLRARGIPISVDINIRLGASFDAARYLEGVVSLLPECDIVKASDEDLAALGLGDEPRVAARAAWQRMGRGVLVLTEGRGGSVLVDASGEIARPAFPVARVEDTVGAGDTFHSAFVASLYRAGALNSGIESVPRDALVHAVDFAAAAAAINVSRAGCDPPTRDEVDRFMEATRR